MFSVIEPNKISGMTMGYFMYYPLYSIINKKEFVFEIGDKTFVEVDVYSKSDVSKFIKHIHKEIDLIGEGLLTNIVKIMNCFDDSYAAKKQFLKDQMTLGIKTYYNSSREFN
jgi:hypothetical protein